MSEGMKFSDLLDRLPPLISRRDVPKLLGGIISAKSLANADSRGEGPEARICLGRRVAYPTISLLEWLVKKRRIKKS